MLAEEQQRLLELRLRLVELVLLHQHAAKVEEGAPSALLVALGAAS